MKRTLECEDLHMLKKHKSNLKKTWQIMKDVINRKRKSSSPPEYFDVNGEYVTDKNKISNGFNKFYVNIGPNLCKSLPNHNVDPMSYLTLFSLSYFTTYLA